MNSIGFSIIYTVAIMDAMLEFAVVKVSKKCSTANNIYEETKQKVIKLLCFRSHLDCHIISWCSYYIMVLMVFILYHGALGYCSHITVLGST